MPNDLDRLLEFARQRPVSKEERDKQRLSFAYGNTHLSNPRITRDSIKDAADQLAANPVTLTIANE